MTASNPNCLLSHSKPLRTTPMSREAAETAGRGPVRGAAPLQLALLRAHPHSQPRCPAPAPGQQHLQQRSPPGRFPVVLGLRCTPLAANSSMATATPRLDPPEESAIANAHVTVVQATSPKNGPLLRMGSARQHAPGSSSPPRDYDYCRAQVSTPPQQQQLQPPPPQPLPPQPSQMQSPQPQPAQPQPARQPPRPQRLMQQQQLQPSLQQHPAVPFTNGSENGQALDMTKPTSAVMPVSPEEAALLYRHISSYKSMPTL